jgi:hypothetical protein
MKGYQTGVTEPIPPLGLTSLNRKNLPIEVTVVGLVQLRQFGILSSVFYPNYKLCNNNSHWK